MIYGEWEPTMHLQFRDGRLEQKFSRQTLEFRCYNGNPTPRECKGYEQEWRIVASAASARAGQ